MHPTIIKNLFLVALTMSFSVYSLAQDSATSKPTRVNTSVGATSNKNFKRFSIGINAGILKPSVAIGGSNDFTKPQLSFGYGANLKYQLSQWLAVQADVVKGTLKGNQSEPLFSGGPAANRYITSFETDLSFAASVGGVITFGSILIKNKIVPYLSAGGGIAHYNVKVVPAGTSTLVDYPAHKPIKEFFVPVGAGLRVNLSSLINLDLGYRMNFIDGDNFDGTRIPGNGNHKDKFQYGFLGLEFALGNKSKKQLMFYDPIDHLNDQINILQTQVDTLFSRLNIVDSDGDGVIDKLDREPNTPPGCPVDTHGVTKDTDGDGVPDCKDKQLITPTECQPVDADGVGKCPPPECCNNMTKESAATCSLGDLPSLSFKGNSKTLSADAKAMLATVASKVKNSPNCTITISGYPAVSKSSQALCNKRLDAIKNYLSESEGISSERITTNCKVAGGDANTIDITSN